MEKTRDLPIVASAAHEIVSVTWRLKVRPKPGQPEQLPLVN